VNLSRVISGSPVGSVAAARSRPRRLAAPRGVEGLVDGPEPRFRARATGTRTDQRRFARPVSPLDEDDLVLVCRRRKAGVELGVHGGQLVAVNRDCRRRLEQITGDDFLHDRVGQVRIRS
jgi:hypothetical protein